MPPLQILLSNFCSSTKISPHFFYFVLFCYTLLSSSTASVPHSATLLPSGAERGQLNNFMSNYGNYSATSLLYWQCCQVKPERLIYAASAHYHWSRITACDCVTILKSIILRLLDATKDKNVCRMLSMGLERYGPQQWPEMFITPSSMHVWPHANNTLIKILLYSSTSCQKLHMVPLKHLETLYNIK